MRKLRGLFCVGVLLSLAIVACNKNNGSTPNYNQPNTQTGFQYGENGTSTLTLADSAVAYVQHNTIIVYKDNKTVIEFVLDNHNQGSHSLAKQYAMTYVKDGKYWEASAGNLDITSNNGSTLSGSFDATAGSGITTVNSVAGKFTNIPIR